MKIGLIAMSGVRAQNAELMKLGLTLPGFVERSKVIASLPSLSLLTLAGLTPSRFDVEYREILDLQCVDVRQLSRLRERTLDLDFAPDHESCQRPGGRRLGVHGVDRPTPSEHGHAIRDRRSPRLRHRYL